MEEANESTALRDLINEQSKRIQSLQISNPVLGAIQIEVTNATAQWPPFNSAHEAFAVLMEEIDELWDHVKTHQTQRDLEAMKKEATQVAAMAVRFISEVCTEEKGRK